MDYFNQLADEVNNMTEEESLRLLINFNRDNLDDILDWQKKHPNEPYLDEFTNEELIAETEREIQELEAELKKLNERGRQ